MKSTTSRSILSKAVSMTATHVEANLTGINAILQRFPPPQSCRPTYSNKWKLSLSAVTFFYFTLREWDLFEVILFFRSWQLIARIKPMPPLFCFPKVDKLFLITSYVRMYLFVVIFFIKCWKVFPKVKLMGGYFVSERLASYCEN
jgi:hypothetical protein